MTDPTLPPAPAAVVSSGNPGKGLGIAGLIVDFFIAPLGLILSIIGKVQASKAGAKNAPAVWGIVLGILFTIGQVILIVVLVGLAATVAAKCADLGAGTHIVGGVTYTCS
jgi:hypothetical protein